MSYRQIRATKTKARLILNLVSFIFLFFIYFAGVSVNTRKMSYWL